MLEYIVNKLCGFYHVLQRIVTILVSYIMSNNLYLL